MATFGYTSLGSLSTGSNQDPIGSRFTAPENGTITAINWYSGDYYGATNYHAAVFANDGSNQPAAKLNSSVSPQSVTAPDTLYSLTIPDTTIVSGTSYWLCLFGASANAEISYNATPDFSDQTAKNSVATYPTWIDPFWDGNAAFLQLKLSIWATYTPTGGGGGGGGGGWASDTRKVFLG